MVGWLAGWLDEWLAGWLAEWLDGWLPQSTSRLDSHSESPADVLLNMGVWAHRHRRERAQDASSLLTYFTYLLLYKLHRHGHTDDAGGASSA